jgi:hypothetical protein
MVSRYFYCLILIFIVLPLGVLVLLYSTPLIILGFFYIGMLLQNLVSYIFKYFYKGWYGFLLYIFNAAWIWEIFPNLSGINKFFLPLLLVYIEFKLFQSYKSWFWREKTPLPEPPSA